MTWWLSHPCFEKNEKIGSFPLQGWKSEIFETTTELDKCLGKGYGSTKRANPKNITQQEVVVLQIAWRVSSSSSIPTETEEYSNILPPSDFYVTSNMFIWRTKKRRKMGTKELYRYNPLIIVYCTLIPSGIKDSKIEYMVSLFVFGTPTMTPINT